MEDVSFGHWRVLGWVKENNALGHPERDDGVELDKAESHIDLRNQAGEQEGRQDISKLSGLGDKIAADVPSAKVRRSPPDRRSPFGV